MATEYIPLSVSLDSVREADMCKLLVGLLQDVHYLKWQLRPGSAEAEEPPEDLPAEEGTNGTT